MKLEKFKQLQPGDKIKYQAPNGLIYIELIYEIGVIDYVLIKRDEKKNCDQVCRRQIISKIVKKKKTTDHYRISLENRVIDGVQIKKGERIWMSNIPLPESYPDTKILSPTESAQMINSLVNRNDRLLDEVKLVRKEGEEQYFKNVSLREELEKYKDKKYIGAHAARLDAELNSATEYNNTLINRIEELKEQLKKYEGLKRFGTASIYKDKSFNWCNRELNIDGTHEVWIKPIPKDELVTMPDGMVGLRRSE